MSILFTPEQGLKTTGIVLPAMGRVPKNNGQFTDRKP